MLVINNTEHLPNIYMYIHTYSIDTSINEYQKTSVMKSIITSFRITKTQERVRGPQQKNEYRLIY